MKTKTNSNFSCSTLHVTWSSSDPTFSKSALAQPPFLEFIFVFILQAVCQKIIGEFGNPFLNVFDCKQKPSHVTKKRQNWLKKPQKSNGNETRVFDPPQALTNFDSK